MGEGMNADHFTTEEMNNSSKYQVGACSCSKCASACRRPGWFLPSQIAPLAKALGLTVQELFDKHLAVDWWVDSPDVFVLAPRLKGEKGGEMYPPNPEGGCHWFKNGKCAIHSEGKPYECQQLGHGSGDEMIHAEHSKVADAWRAKKHQRMIERLLGEPPETPQEEGFGFGFDFLMRSMLGG